MFPPHPSPGGLGDLAVLFVRAGPLKRRRKRGAVRALFAARARARLVRRWVPSLSSGRTRPRDWSEPVGPVESLFVLASLGSPESFHFRPQIRRGYPLNLSISISGGEETN